MNKSPIKPIKEDWQCRLCNAAHDYTLFAHRDENGEAEWVMQLCLKHLIWIADKIKSEIEIQEGR